MIMKQINFLLNKHLSKTTANIVMVILIIIGVIFSIWMTKTLNGYGLSW